MAIGKFVSSLYIPMIPLPNGNGRMLRLLFLLLLYKNGFDAGKYVSFEEQINKYKACYYESLRKSSDGWGSSEKAADWQTAVTV